MDGMRPRFVLVSVVVPLIVVAGSIVAGRWIGDEAAADPRASLAAALDVLPADTQVVGFTDWAGVRRELDVDQTTTGSARQALAAEASLRDLSTRSVIGQLVEEMHDAYGWSAADLDWEAYGQAQDGAVMVARLGGSVSFDSVRSHLRALGYARDGEVWIKGSAGIRASPELATTLAAVTLVPQRRLVVAADRAAYAATVRRTISRDAASLLAQRGAADVAAALVGADSVLLQTGPFACRATSLEDQGADVRAQARAAVQRAGGLVEPDFAGRALDAGTTRQTMRFAFGFGSPAVARRQLSVRTALSSGPFIGRSGRVEDSLVLRSSAVRGSTAVLRFRHDPDSTAYMDGAGPLLLAGCPVDGPSAADRRG